MIKLQSSATGDRYAAIAILDRVVTGVIIRTRGVMDRLINNFIGGSYSANRLLICRLKSDLTLAGRAPMTHDRCLNGLGGNKRRARFEAPRAPVIGAPEKKQARCKRFQSVS
jgi:hypothetical protein